MSRTAVFFLLVLAPALGLLLALLGYETLEKNFLGWLLLAVGVFYTAGMIIYTWILKQPFWQPKTDSKTVSEEKGDRSFWLILPGMLIAFFAPPLEYIYFPEFLPRTIWMEVIGLIFIVIALLLRFWTRAAAGEQYSGHVQVTEKHQLVQSGPYRYIRHPGYAGYFLIALGICIGYSSLIGLAAIPIFMVPGFAYRMNVEEKLLTKSFGDEYRIYARRTKRILPGIW